MNIEENYWADAVAHDAAESFLPSDLVPNQKLVFEKFQHAPTSIAFQATAVPLVVYNGKTASFIKGEKDLADPRLKKRITVPLPGDVTAGGFFMNLADELGKDYKDPQQMKEVVDWFIANIGPNVLKYTTDTSEIMQLLQTGFDRCSRILAEPGPAGIPRKLHGHRPPVAHQVVSDVRLRVDSERRCTSGPSPDLCQLAAEPRRPVPERAGRSSTAHGAS